MKKILCILLLTTLAVSCSSKKKKTKIKEEDNSETIKKDYIVRNASHKIRPIWVVDATEWAEDKNRSDKYRYFSYETGPMVNREIACSKAVAKSKVHIAGMITTFIQKTFGESSEGRAIIDENKPKTRALRSYVDDTLAEKIQALIYGAEVIKTYWEKRHYQKELGAKKNYYGYTCGSLVRIRKSRLKSMIAKAKEGIEEETDDPELKEKVREALEDVEDDFIKARKGQI